MFTVELGLVFDAFAFQCLFSHSLQCMNGSQLTHKTLINNNKMLKLIISLSLLQCLILYKALHYPWTNQNNSMRQEKHIITHYLPFTDEETEIS